VTRDEIIEAISKMTVLDLAELVKALEAKFGVSAAAPMMAGAGPAVSAVGAETVVVEEEKTEFDLILKGAGEQKIQVIKVVRELTSLGLREAKDVVEKAPSELLKGISKEQAQAAKEKLEAVGAAVEIK
jgi:large subunit ribosomal protein L7/L12